MDQTSTCYDVFTWIGHCDDGQRIESSVGVVSPVYTLSAAELAALDAQTARNAAALCSYALNHPEVPVHDAPY